MWHTPCGLQRSIPPAAPAWPYAARAPASAPPMPFPPATRGPPCLPCQAPPPRPPSQHAVGPPRRRTPTRPAQARPPHGSAAPPPHPRGLPTVPPAPLAKRTPWRPNSQPPCQRHLAAGGAAAASLATLRAPQAPRPPLPRRAAPQYRRTAPFSRPQASTSPRRRAGAGARPGCALRAGFTPQARRAAAAPGSASSRRQGPPRRVCNPFVVAACSRRRGARCWCLARRWATPAAAVGCPSAAPFPGVPPRPGRSSCAQTLPSTPSAPSRPACGPRPHPAAAMGRLGGTLVPNDDPERLQRVMNAKQRIIGCAGRRSRGVKRKCFQATPLTRAARRAGSTWARWTRRWTRSGRPRRRSGRRRGRWPRGGGHRGARRSLRAPRRAPCGRARRAGRGGARAGAQRRALRRRVAVSGAARHGAWAHPGTREPPGTH
jgi:hypothetical protein